MSTLRVILDQMLAPVPGGVGRSTEELTRALISTAPRGSRVAGFVPASTDEEYATIRERLPGLAELHKSALARRELAFAWQHGFTPIPGEGLLHATSLLAPLRRHDRIAKPDSQVVVTIHDAVPWTHPETLSPRSVSWHTAMGKRAARYADAVVVPTHAVAEELSAFLDLGERVRVVGGAPSESLRLGDDADARARALDLPPRFVASIGSLEPRKGLEPLIRAFAVGAIPADVVLVLVGSESRGEVDAVAAAAGLATERIRVMGNVGDGDLAVILDRAAVFAFPSLAEGFGLPLVEAFSLGTPVVHSDAPALVEVAADAGLIVPREDADGYPTRLAENIRDVLEDTALAERLSISGRDRAKAFSWRDSAEKIWQLHADL